jgi:hypothetical protein
MKKFIFTILVTAISFITYAQSPREMLQMADDLVKLDANNTYCMSGEGKIVLADGKEETGMIKLYPGEKEGAMSILYVYTPDKMKPLKFYASDAQYAMIGDVKLIPVKGKPDFGNTFEAFGVVLNKNADDDLWIYRLYKVTARSADEMRQYGGAPLSLNALFYAQLLEDKKAWELGGTSLSPFHKYMSKALKNCETVANKIKEKEEGYNYKAISFREIAGKKEEGSEILFRIMKEYNECVIKK